MSGILLILYALGQIQNNNTRYLPYEKVKEDLRMLLKESGPRRKTYHPEHPFLRLKNDGIWQLNTSIDNIDKASDRWLTNNGVVGGFNEDTYSLLVSNQNLFQEITEIL